MCTSACYLDSYIWYDESKREWLKERTAMWEREICTISETAGQYPQEIYATVVRVIQSEWIFLQRVTWDMGDTFTGVEKIVWGKNLPHLFFGKKKILSLIVGPLSKMTIKMAVLGILNPVASAN